MVSNKRKKKEQGELQGNFYSGPLDTCANTKCLHVFKKGDKIVLRTDGKEAYCFESGCSTFRDGVIRLAWGVREFVDSEAKNT
jgi:hypothetical protein